MQKCKKSDHGNSEFFTQGWQMEMKGSHSLILAEVFVYCSTDKANKA
ncbi:hypothetical protein MCRH_1333 [Moraxella catarrhalis RH4]|nr:hypothetical protein MCRH_1333 [Moraxella catarrhalis RH4]